MNPFDKDPSHDYVKPRKTPVALIAAMFAAVVLGLGIAVVAFSSGGGSGSNNGKPAGAELQAQSAGPDIGPSPQPEAPTPEPTPLPPPPTPEPEPAAAAPQLGAVGAGDRLSIPRFGINAPLTYKTVGSNGQMPDPDGSDDIAYYNFSAWPGFGGAPGRGGNAVFAGHVDSGHNYCDYGKTPPPCAAVLWNLSKVGSGDEIDVKIAGTVYVYRVTSVESVSDHTDFQPIVAATSKETITIITCGGSFNPRTKSYDSRQVVKAERV